jgi:hypothetical protein
VTYIHFACDQEHQRLIDYLTKHAIDQSGHFVKVYPWVSRCSAHQFLYIALQLPVGVPLETCRERGLNILIHGWMSVSILKWPPARKNGRTIAHINELSTRQHATKGVGKRLLEIMERQTKSMDIDFIELLPLPEVKPFYEKIGYKEGLDNLMYKVLRREPTKAYKKHLIQQKLQQAEDDQADLESFIDEIKEELEPDEVLAMQKKIEEDDIFMANVVAVYTDEDGGIDAVRELIGIRSLAASAGTRRRTSKRIKSRRTSRQK